MTEIRDAHISYPEISLVTMTVKRGLDRNRRYGKTHQGRMVTEQSEAAMPNDQAYQKSHAHFVGSHALVHIMRDMASSFLNINPFNNRSSARRVPVLPRGVRSTLMIDCAHHVVEGLEMVQRERRKSCSTPLQCTKHQSNVHCSKVL